MSDHSRDLRSGSIDHPAKDIPAKRRVSHQTFRSLCHTLLHFSDAPIMRQNQQGLQNTAVIGATVAENFGVDMPKGTIGYSVLSRLQQ